MGPLSAWRGWSRLSPAADRGLIWRLHPPRAEHRAAFHSRVGRAQWRRGATQTVNARAATALAWSLCLVTMALLVLGMMLWAANGFPLLLGTEVATGGAGIRVLSVLTFALIAVVGLLIATRQQTNPIGWILLVAVLVSSFDLFSQNFVTYALVESPTTARM